MIARKTMGLILVLSLVLFTAFNGCGGGGSGDSPTNPARPSLQIVPSAYNFGTVTTGNSAAPLEVKIMNDGSAELHVSSISLIDDNNFSLDLGGGSTPCNSQTPTVAPGGMCTFLVNFVPQSNASFQTTLTVDSENPGNFSLLLSGNREEISTLNVRINQLEFACPSGVVTAYVSVTDQAGYTVTGLTLNDFTVAEVGGYAGPPASSPFVENTATISTALVMDYSASISDFPEKLVDMEEGALSFVNRLGVDDEAEIIKFGEVVDVLQPFTSDQNLLATAIFTPWYEGARTALYDACKKAVDDTTVRTRDRKAVIVISDGKDSFSTLGLDALVDTALSNNIPLFSVGLGDSIDVATLRRMADDTGGLFYEATTSDNLKTINQQLSDVLFSYQYILTYTSGLGAGATADLTVSAALNGIPPGSDTKSITQCP